MDLILSNTDFVEIGLIFVCLLLSGFFSGAETAITSLGALRTKHLIEQEGNKAAPLNFWLAHPHRTITTILVFNNIVNIFSSALATDLAIRHFESTAVGISTGIMTFLILVFGEVIPKSFAKVNSERLCYAALKIIHVMYKIIFPIVWLLSEFAGVIVRLLGEDDKVKPPITEDEIEFLFNVGKEHGVIEEVKEEMLTSVLEFDETKVREIMTPRTAVIAIDKESSFMDALNVCVQSGHSRIPVYDGQIDNIIGVLFAKDLLRFINQNDIDTIKNSSLEGSLIRETFYTPETKPIIDVLNDLKRTKNHLVIVIDEYGGTAGIVTLEDIIEEIVGDIQDEYDLEEAEILEIEENVFDVAGSINVNEFIEYFKLSEDSNKNEDDSDTVGGWITEIMGELPQIGQSTQIGPLQIEVTDVDKHRVDRLRVTRIPDWDENQEQEQNQETTNND